MTDLTEENEAIAALIKRGALFVINHSGGKDSQAMFIKLRNAIPLSQLLVIHADLPGADWPGTWDHVVEYSNGVETIKCRSIKTFEEMVRHRGMFPSPSNRQCTSDLKRGPIERTIRRYLKANPQFGGLVVNCMGMRADESASRSKLKTFKKNERNSKAGREWYDWLPIHEMTEFDVFDSIAQAGEKPHWIYKAGMTRASCMFCIMASKEDLKTAARLAPDALEAYSRMENDIDHCMMMPTKADGARTLKEIIAS